MYVFKKECSQLLIDTIVNGRVWIGEARCAAPTAAAAHTPVLLHCLAAGGQSGTGTKWHRREGEREGGREIAGRATRTTVHLTGQRIF